MRCSNCDDDGHITPCGLCIFCVPAEFEGERSDCPNCKFVFTLSTTGLCAGCEIIKGEYIPKP